MYHTWRNRQWRCCNAGVRERDHIGGYGGGYGRSVARGGSVRGERKGVMGREREAALGEKEKWEC